MYSDRNERKVVPLFHTKTFPVAVSEITSLVEPIIEVNELGESKKLDSIILGNQSINEIMTTIIT